MVFISELVFLLMGNDLIRVQQGEQQKSPTLSAGLSFFLQGLKAVATRYNDKTGYPAFLLGILNIVHLEFIFRFLKHAHPKL